MPKWVKILLSIVALIAGIILVLFIFSLIFYEEYGGFMGLIRHLLNYIGFIWTDRIVK